jgi:hypothetical protein
MRHDKLQALLTYVKQQHSSAPGPTSGQSDFDDTALEVFPVSDSLDACTQGIIVTMPAGWWKKEREKVPSNTPFEVAWMV